MLIALEGCDGVGKSTLAQDIVDQIKRDHPDDEVHLIHAGPLKTDPYTAYLEPLKDYRPDSGVHYVLDRWHIGELVYGPLYREKSAINPATYVWLELWFASRGMTLVHVNQDLDVIRDRLETRGEDFLQPEHVAQVWRDFQTFTRNALTYAKTVRPDGDNKDWVDWILATARLREVETRHLPRSYVGSPDAAVLLVGEKRGGKPPYAYEGAFRPMNGNSGEYLWDGIFDESNMFDGGYTWHDYAAINSDPEEEPELEKAVGASRYIVALGGAASKNMSGMQTKTMFNVARAPHPQYVRRFHNSKKSEYAQLLLSPYIVSGEDLSKWPNS